MLNVRTRWIAVPALLLALPVLAQHGGTDPAKGDSAASAAVAIGKPAPDFTAKDSDGKEHKLSGLKGKIVVLEWTCHKCPVVDRHIKAKTSANTLAKFKGKDVVWLMIDSNKTADADAEAIKKWQKEHNAAPVLMDASGKIGKMYGAKTTPHIFVIDAKGTLAYMGAIDDDKAGDKPTKKNYAEEAINALLKGSTVATATTEPYGCSVKY